MLGFLRGSPPARLLALAVVLAFCSLAYQMAVAACFVMMTGDDVLWQSLTIAVYLAAVGAGTWACGRSRGEGLWERLFRVELGLAAAGALAVPGILTLETLYRLHFHYSRFPSPDPPVWPFAATLSAGHGATALVGFLSGYEIPLLVRLARKAGSADALNWILGANYLGALIGGLSFSFILLPALDVPRAALAVSAMTLGACAWLVAAEVLPATPRRIGGLAATGAVLALAAAAAGPFYRFYASALYAATLGLPVEHRAWAYERGGGLHWGRALSKIRGAAALVERRRSRYQHLDLIDDPRPHDPLEAHFNRRLSRESGLPGGFSLYLDRRFQFRGSSEAAYHEYMAHAPVQFFGRVPRDVLILGGGDGLLAREILKYGPRVASVTNVELDPAMIELARRDPRLRRLNGDSYGDPRVRVVIDDAFFYVRNSRQTYDAVYVDLPYPFTYGLTRLYSVEFFAGAARLLKPGGVLTLDCPLDSYDDPRPLQDFRTNSVLLSTLRAAGFATLVPYSSNTPDLVSAEHARALGVLPSDYDPDVDRLQRRLEALKFLRSHPGYPLAGAGPDAADYVVVESGWRGETLVAARVGRSGPSFTFKDYGIPLDALNPARLHVIQFQRFPHRLEPRLVNSIFRPVLFKPLHLADAAFQ